MTNTISFSGARRDLSISQSEINAISRADSLDDVSSVWGKIVDWFCGTHKEEAKEALFTLMHQSNSDGSPISNDQKLEAFHKLRDLASPICKENFQYKIENGKLNLAIKGIGWSVEVAPQHDDRTAKIMARVVEGYGSAADMHSARRALQADIPRCNYVISENGHDKVYSRGRDKGLTDIYMSVDRVVGGSATEYQQQMVSTLACQRGVLAVREELVTEDPHFCAMGNNHELTFTMESLPSGDVMVDIHYQNTAPDGKEHKEYRLEMGYYRHTEFNARFIIGKETTHCAYIESHGQY